MPKQMIAELRDGQQVDSLFSVKYRKPPMGYKGKQGCWFTVGLSDMTGEIELRFWGGHDKACTQRIYASFREDDVVHVVGTVRKAMDSGRLEVSVSEDSGKLEKSFSYSIDDFVGRTKHDTDRLMGELAVAISEIREPHLKALMESFFSDKTFVEGFRKSPAAITMHQAYIGGLLEHTTHVLEICRALLKIYPQLDMGLVFAGAILHDIGKMREFSVTTNIKQTPDGMLRGHITIGQEMLLEKIGKLVGFPENLKIKLAHIMLAHHGGVEYGSPVDPKFPEAEAVHYADECDAKLDQYVSTKEDPRTEDFRVYSQKLRKHVYVK